jgi:hypothetical protein
MSEPLDQGPPMSEPLDRREFLWAASGAPMVIASVQAAARKPTKRPSGEMRAVVTLGGKTYAFNEAEGEDLGDFEGPGFVQRCVRVRRPDIPLTVFFRPDRDSDRAEVVFELGRLWGKANAEAANLDRYHVAIELGGKALAQIDVPRHWWFSAWRWQSALRPVIRKVSDLIREGLLLPYEDRLARFAKPTTPIRYGGPMDSAGIYKAMGATGERPDIGPVTEWQGDYIVTGSRAALGTLLIQAEAAGSIPWHMRDETTGSPVDFYAHPTANWYYRPAAGAENIKVVNTEWAIDDAHEPALAYLPYLLTGDPYYLEKLQFQGTWSIGWGLYHRQVQKLPVLYPGQTRAYAWSLRTLAQLARVSPEKAPRWLQPRAYWKRLLDDNLTYFTRNFVEDPRPESAFFRAATLQDPVGSWQECFLAVAIGWAVLLGFEGWRKAFEWKIGSTIALSDGRSGWPRQWCSPYYYKLQDPSKGQPYKSWGELWRGFRADPANKVVEPFDSSTAWPQPNSLGFLLYTRGALALATHLGVAEAKDCFRFVDAMTLDRLNNNKEAMNYRWCLEGAS